MSEPDEAMVEAVAMAIRDDRGALDVDADGIPDSQWRTLARAALSVPVVRDALARDAQVREIVARLPYGATDSQMVALAEDVIGLIRGAA